MNGKFDSEPLRVPSGCQANPGRSTENDETPEDSGPYAAGGGRSATSRIDAESSSNWK